MATIEHVPFHADPILAAIDAHEEAWSVFQVAPEGEASLQAEDDLDAARAALLGTPCATRFGALALLRHLRWWLREETEFAESYQPDFAVAQARAADLTLFLGYDMPLAVIPTAAPLGRLPPVSSLYDREAPTAPADEDGPGSIHPWQAVTLLRPDTAHVRALRFLDGAGEMLAVLLLIVSGIGVTGLASLL